MIAHALKRKSTSLSEYRRKRDFARTREPEGSTRASTGGAFVIQKHAASHLHYDLRLEVDGVLKSWAVPKGPSLDPNTKRLAVQVEDHPLDYADFEGSIPKGQYGGGTVLVWDRGTWIPVDDPEEGLARGKLHFMLKGRRLKGEWSLIRMKGFSGSKPQWLLRKVDDDKSRVGNAGEITSTETTSVKSGKTIEELAEKAAGVKVDAKPSRKRTALKSSVNGKELIAAKRSRIPDLSQLEGARKAAFPDSLQPQLATLVDAVPAGDAWIHEIKFDGYRLMAFIADGHVRLRTRRGLDWTERFPGVAKSLAALPVKNAVIDGEAVVLDDRGVSHFQLLQSTIGSGQRPIHFFAFDLIHLNGWDLQKAPLLERKKLLAALFPNSDGSQSLIRYSDHVEGTGKSIWENACRLGAEGIISKQASSNYVSGRSSSWRKIKCLRRQEFVIGGFTSPRGGRSHFGSLLVGYYDGREFRYAGRVGTGFDEKSLRSLRVALKPLEQDSTSFSDVPPSFARGAHWVRPRLVVEIEFTEWTDDGLLRHPSFKGLREDKNPADVIRETPVQAAGDNQPSSPMKTSPGKPKPSRSSKSKSRSTVEDWRFTHPERVLFPKEKITKRDLAEFYLRIADHILPYIVGRPLSLLRCPEGQGKPCFMQRHLHGTFPSGLRPVKVRGKKAAEEYVLLDNIDGLMSLVQMGVLEIHPWGSREKSLETADYLVFDLDPGPGIEWKAMVDGARLMREELEAADLKAFVRTSGGKGLHVLTPLPAGVPWPKAKELAKTIALVVAGRDPKRFVATMSKSKRTNRIFIDYLRNDRGATAVASYSTRARTGAPVATPISWDELGRISGADAFRVDNLERRLSQQKRDPWAEFRRLMQP